LNGLGTLPDYNWLSDGTVRDGSFDPYFQQNFFNVTSNYLQVMLAAIRFDLGNVYPNNILYNTSIVDDTLFSTQVAQTEIGPIKVPIYAPDIFKTRTIEGEPYSALTDYWNEQPITFARINIPFLCHFTQAKGHLNAAVSILVAIASLMGTFWTGMAFCMSFLATQNTKTCTSLH
jgi:hypothetical protein